MTTTAAEPESAAAGQSRAWRPWLLRLLLAAISGFVLFLSFAPRPLWWLAPFAFAGLGLALYRRRFWGGFGYGFAFGLAFFLPLLTWLRDFLGAGFGPWPWLGLSATLALYHALAGGLITWVARLPAAPIWMALLVIAAETPRAWFPLGGFPWGRVGFSQPDGAYLSLASIGGAPLVGFAVALSGFGLAALILRAREHDRRALLTPAAAALVPLLAGLALWPSIGTGAQDGSRTVAAVQGNSPDSGLSMFVEGADLRRTHLAESQRLIGDIRAGKVAKPDLVVWPETATDVDGDDPAIDRLVAEFGVSALIGAVYELPDGRAENALVAWDPKTGQGQRYTKQQLVPFGEYVPSRELAELVTPFVRNIDERVQGTGDPIALNVAGTKVGAMICYEAAYDYPARDAVLGGAELLTAPTNNAWYGRSEMSYQQLSMARLRAVEHSRAVVVSATSGVSAIVQPDGSVTASTSLFTAASLVGQVPLRTTTTLSDQLGAWTEYGLDGAALAAVLAGLVSRARIRRRAEQEMAVGENRAGG
ncbi:apolipoprotein N-acyltransferase [Amycolatopsis nigrescens]|uniref:apolipoprotein N-acyltransferase n=1 Tax=Amycolatopsis nigrescens TaxID=381445 RepID=UPI00037ABF8D|nr:apolipoprotein N-acyltransferase [Amycolatopsis nigrescens]